MSSLIGCEEVERSLPELAAGFLPGNERAVLVAHLGGCASCRRLSEDLIEVVDELVLLTPPVEPPAGFESRALAAMTADRTRRRTRSNGRQRWLAAAALIAALFGGAVAGDSLGHRGGHRPAAAVLAERSAALVGPGGATWGTAVVHAGQDGWAFVAMRWDLPDGTFSVQLAGPGIPTVQLDGLALVNGQASLGRSVAGDLSRVRVVRIVDSSGTEICRATFV